MLTLARSVALGAALLVTTGVPASARDTCFTLPGLAGSLNFVAKGLNVPGRNKCKPIDGFSELLGWTLSGTACTKADGSAVRLGIAGHGLLAATNSFQVGCTIPLPGMTGGTCFGHFITASSVGDEAIPVASSIDLTSCAVNVP